MKPTPQSEFQVASRIGRIVIINDTSVNNGGAAALALQAARRLRAKGHRVSFVCGDAGENADLAALGIDVHGAGGASLLERRARNAAITGLYDARKAQFLADWIAREDTPDTVYHVHAWAQIFSPSIFTALAPVAPRVFIHAHDMFLACPNGVYMDYQRDQVCQRVPLSVSCLTTHCDKRVFAHKMWRVARQTLVRRSFDTTLPWGGIVQIHPGMQERLERAGLPSGLIRTVRNPADTYCESRVRAEENTGFLYVGRLEADKGVRLLAEAAARTGVSVTFVGDGPLRAELEARFPEMRLAGWCDRAQIGEIAQGCRALVMPSAHPEPFALVLPEAIHSGLPVLVSDTALMATEIARAGLGVAVKVTDPSAFDAALLSMAALAPDKVKAMSLLGFSGPERLAPSPDGWADALVHLYERVV